MQTFGCQCVFYFYFYFFFRKRKNFQKAPYFIVELVAAAEPVLSLQSHTSASVHKAAGSAVCPTCKLLNFTVISVSFWFPMHFKAGMLELNIFMQYLWHVALCRLPQNREGTWKGCDITLRKALSVWWCFNLGLRRLMRP